MYDIIGDIHGHATELVQLLEKMGYRNEQGAYRCPDRQAVFVGDLIDRGPEIRETIQIVSRMCDEDSAQIVMGNHEFNLLAYHTSDPDHPGEFLRKHSAKNKKQNAETHSQLTENELSIALEWFRGLPMWLELDGIRVVHACWHAEQMTLISEELNACDGVTTEFLRRSTDVGQPLYGAVNAVLKGIEIPLPMGRTTVDKDGHIRKNMRIQWFRLPRVGETCEEYSLTSDAGVPDCLLPENVIEKVCPYPEDDPPLFLGHYWLLADQPSPLAKNIACTDYSVAKNGMLAAYRWNGESVLLAENFVSVPARVVEE